MATQDEIERLAQAGEVERYRATPLRPAVFMTSVLVWATVVALICRVPTWAGVFLSSVTAISFLWFLVGYVYLFVNNPEMLRAERYRGRKRGRLAGEVESKQTQELSDYPQRHIEPGNPGSVVVRADDGKLDLNVGGSRRMIDK